MPEKVLMKAEHCWKQQSCNDQMACIVTLHHILFFRVLQVLRKLSLL